MSKDIFIVEGDLSSRLLKKPRSKLDSASDKLGTINYSPMYRGPTGYLSLYPASVSSEVIRLKNSVDTVREKLRLYADILDSGPDSICDVDAKCKNDLTNWWDRATYEDGWLTKFFGNDLKTSGAVGVWEGAVEGEFLGVGASAGYGVNTLYYEGKIKNSASWDVEKGDVGVSTKASIKGGLVEVSGEASYGVLDVEGEVSVGVASAEAKGEINLMHDGKFDPSVEVGAKASVEGVSGEIEAQLGTEDFNAHAKAEGTVGVAEAEAKGSISKDGVELKAEVGAAVLQGEVSGGITIFGIRIDAEAKGSVLSAEAGVTYSMKKDSLTIGGKLALVAGLGLEIKISW